jgi:hypothetical protein
MPTDVSDERACWLRHAGRAGYETWRAPGDTPWEEQSAVTQEAYVRLAAAAITAYDRLRVQHENGRPGAGHP